MREERDRRRITDLAEDLMALQERALSGATTGELLAAVRDDTGLGTALDGRLDASRRSIDRSAHGDDIAALVAIADLEPDPAAFPGWLEEQLRRRRTEAIGVHLSTVHRVKGQEWPHVIVHEATAGLFPHRLAADIEEERRVFHVAITRAAQTVLLLAGDPPSPFLAELAEARGPDDRPPVRMPAADTRSTGDEELRERLRAWRLERARADGVPAFVVFADTTLAELVRTRPRDRPALRQVAGIGPTKLERYGDALLAVIAATDPEAEG
jgi:DNA helicase-2/ATP-dependent DNA helicase PcrA